METKIIKENISIVVHLMLKNILLLQILNLFNPFILNI